MSPDICQRGERRRAHDWLREIGVSFVPGPEIPWIESMTDDLLETFRAMGHAVQPSPDENTDVILTTARFGKPLDWRKALLFTARRRFGLAPSPTIYTLVPVTPNELEGKLNHFRTVLSKEPPDPADYNFPGLADDAYRVLFEQGRRGGPILALERMVQSQAKCIDVLLVVGDEQPEEAYLFNLVGAYPRIPADEDDSFYRDIVTRIVTAESTQEVTNHVAIDETIPSELWNRLSTLRAMCEAGRHLGARGFFTEMVRIADLVNVPAVASAVSSQYSEGCFSTWDPTLDALITTVTGSARPVYKGSITERDLAVITGLKPDGSGALIQHVQGRVNAPPSSEAVEMVKMDEALPTVKLGADWESSAQVPVVRSKLHGHRGCAAYHPRHVEYVPMALPYQRYPVTCSTDAQARGIAEAFSRAEALQNPADPRQVVFTVLPGHGIVITEKWVAGARPFQMIWKAMDAGHLQIDSLVPQGPIQFLPRADDDQLREVNE